MTEFAWCWLHVLLCFGVALVIIFFVVGVMGVVAKILRSWFNDWICAAAAFVVFVLAVTTLVAIGCYYDEKCQHLGKSTSIVGEIKK